MVLRCEYRKYRYMTLITMVKIDNEISPLYFCNNFVKPFVF